MERFVCVWIAIMILLSQFACFMLGRVYELFQRLRELDEEEQELIKELEEIDREIAKFKEMVGEDNG